MSQTFCYPDQSTLFCDNAHAVVGAGVESPAGCGGFSPVVTDITDTQLIVDTGGIGWATGAFNGFLLSTLSSIDITSAVYNSGTMNVTDLQIQNGDLWVNFAGQTGGSAVIDFGTNGSSVPVPATLALLGLGLAGIGYQRRKQTKAV